MAKLLALNPAKGFHKCECKDLDDFYRELECGVFDIATRKIGGKYFDIFCDDIGLFKDNNPVSAVDKDLKPMLVGNLIFANHDDQGNTTSLDEDDMIKILSSYCFLYDPKAGRVLVAVKCDY